MWKNAEGGRFVKSNSPISPLYGRYALILLLLVNLLNYIDRQVLYAVFPFIKADMHLSDTALGFLGSAFMICYMISAPLFGWIGDRFSRVRMAAGGLFFWSIATAGAGLASVYPTLLAARTVVGIGEASFGTVSPGLLSEYFPREKRGRILSYFYLAIPVGSALGYVAGGILGQNFGWHTAFLMVAVPGLLLVTPLWLLRQAARSTVETGVAESSHSSAKEYFAFFRSRSFVLNNLAMAAMTFALGGMAQWMPTFLHRQFGTDVAKGDTLFGITTVLAGITGTLAGGWLGDYFQKKNEKGYLNVSAWGFILGAPVIVCALNAPSMALCITAIFFAEFFLFINTGPLNTVIINVTRPGTRAMAFAINIFLVHALGDAVSPTVLGYISDHHGLKTALLITPGIILLAALLCFICTRYIDEDTAKARG